MKKVYEGKQYTHDRHGGHPPTRHHHISIADEIQKGWKKSKGSAWVISEWEVSHDQTINIRKSISEVKETLIVAFVLVVLPFICSSATG